MDVTALYQWLDTHLNSIYYIMDYEPTIDDDADFNDTLAAWFHNPDWNTGQYTFKHLVIDGRGSQFAAWFRTPDAEPHVVYLGSEGGRGVVAKSLDDWVQLIAHEPCIDEYPSFEDDAPACVVPKTEFDGHDFDEEEAEEAKEHLKRYRAAVVEKYGSIGEFSALTAGFEELNAEFAKLFLEN